MGKLYRIGLDIGIGSVGYSVLENDPITESPVQILDLGVRTFDANEVAKTGESKAKARRVARGIRRRSRRRKFRRERMKTLLKNAFSIDVENELKNLLNVDVYELRAKGVFEKLTYGEITKVILTMLKRRGFKSNRKNLTTNKDDGELLNAIKENKAYILEHGYKTIGEAIFKDDRFKLFENGKPKMSKNNEFIYDVRNHGGNYKNCFSRAELVDELKLILQKQKEFNDKINDDLIDEIIWIFSKQRNFDEGPGKQSPYYKERFEIGRCTFLPNEDRAPKASYTFELFSAYSKINSLRINGEELTEDQRINLESYCFENKKEVSFSQIRKVLGIDYSKTFNLCSYNLKQKKAKTKKDNNDNQENAISEEEFIDECEKKKFVQFKNSYEIAKALGYKELSPNKEVLNEVALLLSVCKSDDRIDEYIKNNDILKELDSEQIEKIKGLNFDKFGSLSIKAMEKILPYLESGNRYDEACRLAGFDHSSFSNEKLKYLKGDAIDEELKDITSNVVKRSVHQTLRILNEIIKKYGSPQYVTIELARELSRNFSDRQKIKNSQEDNAENNRKIVEFLQKEFNLTSPKGFDILKYKLYEEQNGKCMYSGKDIDINRLFEHNYVEVDHVLPFSRSMNDGYNNKVLVLASENQNKGNRTPFEFFGDNETKWSEFKNRVELLRNRKKKEFLLKENLSKAQVDEFIERNLNDTKYMSKFLLNLMQKYLLITPSAKYKEKAQIRSVNGAITSYLRKFWGINKLREDGDIHHCIDASVIATVTPGEIQKITNFNKYKEKFVYHDGKFINKITGELMTAEEKENFEKDEITKVADRLPMPYPNFVKELEIRSNVKYKDFSFSDDEKLKLREFGYDEDEINAIKPVFISRMKTVKYTGAIHKETLMSAREFDETQMLIKSVPIQELKLIDKIEEKQFKEDKYPEKSIENYYRPKDDKLLYLKLKEYLVENGKIPDTIEFRKPKKDGTDGPIVKNIKIYQKASNPVITPNGAAQNDAMHRIDIFEKEGKFYICPVYMSDVYAKRLPNKVIERDKPWTIIDNSFNFKFSLYKNDLIKIKSKKEIILKKNFKNPDSKKPDEIKNNEFLVYYNSTNIHTCSIETRTHDNAYMKDGIGVKNLESIEKYYVDIMGKLYKSPKEERKGF